MSSWVRAGYIVVAGVVLSALVNLITGDIPHLYRWLLVGIAALLVVPLIMFGRKEELPRQGEGAVTLADIADELAEAVYNQWDAEARLRRLYDPEPLPVSWQAADADLFEDWGDLGRTARTWPEGPPSSICEWATHPDDLRGSGNELDGVVSRRVPTGRLVILGKPGAGKTLLLVRLILDLLAPCRRQPGGPVPILASLASWNPQEQDLHDWLKYTLTTDNAWLRQVAPGKSMKMSCIDALFKRNLIIPILDGLDEIPEENRSAAITKIDDAFPRSKLVLSSRVNEYRNAVQPPDRRHRKLGSAAGVVLKDLDAADVAAYLKRDAGSDSAAARWTPVLDVLGTSEPVARALRTPLMVGLARTIYNPRPGEPVMNLNPPKELCDSEKFRLHTEVEKYLFDGFISAAYRTHPDHARRSPWQTADAKRWLEYLARHLEYPLEDPKGVKKSTSDRNVSRTTDLAWWELHSAVSSWWIGAVAALVPGIAVGLAAAVREGLGIGLGLGLLTGLAGALIVRFLVQRLFHGAVAGIAWGAASAVAGAFLGGVVGRSIGIGEGPTGGLVGAVGVGLGVGPVGGLLGSLIGGFVGGVGVGLTAGEAPGLPAGIVDGIGGGFAAALILVCAGRNTPARGLRGLGWSRTAIGAGLAAGIGLGVTAGPMAGLVGMLAGFCLGLLGSEADLKSATSPRAVLLRDRSTFLAFGLIAGATVCAGASLAVAPEVGIAGGITVGLVFGCLQAAWGRFTIARYLLAFRGHIPWQLMSFLADAHEKRGVLRQVGAVYQFRHADLQRHLAGRS